MRKKSAKIIDGMSKQKNYTWYAVQKVKSEDYNERCLFRVPGPRWDALLKSCQIKKIRYDTKKSSSSGTSWTVCVFYTSN